MAEMVTRRMLFCLCSIHYYHYDHVREGRVESNHATGTYLPTAIGVDKHQFGALCSTTGCNEAQCLRLSLLLGLLREKDGVDVREHATGRDGHAAEEPWSVRFSVVRPDFCWIR